MMSSSTSGVSLPPGTQNPDGWQDNVGGLPPYRIVCGQDRHVREIEGIIGTSAVQYPDGTIDQTADDSPRVWAEYGAANMTSAQARQFAAEIVAAADEVDGWVTK